MSGGDTHYGIDKLGISDCILVSPRNLLGIVNFNHIETASKCSLDRCNKSFLDTFNIIFCHFFGMRELFAVRDSTWSIDIIRPAVDLSTKSARSIKAQRST